MLELYERYRQDPGAVDAATRQFFADWSPPEEKDPGAAAPGAAALPVGVEKIVGAANLAQSIREYGHLAVELDPLGRPPPGDPSLALEAHSIGEEDLRRLPASPVGGPAAAGAPSAHAAIAELRAPRLGGCLDRARHHRRRRGRGTGAGPFRPPPDNL